MSWKSWLSVLLFNILMDVYVGLWLALPFKKQQYKSPCLPDIHDGLSKLIILGSIPMQNQKQER